MGNAVLSMEHAWNAVALEERIEVVVGAKAKAFLAALLYLLALGCIAWGYDDFDILLWGSPSVFVFIPLISNQLWQKIQADLILRNLAARAVAADLAEQHGIRRNGVSMVFKGVLQLLPPETSGGKGAGHYAPSDYMPENVWICLLQGGVLAFAEREGGPVLRFISSAKADMVLRHETNNDLPDDALVLISAGPYRGTKVAISSPYRGALYVFEKRLGMLVSGNK